MTAHVYNIWSLAYRTHSLIFVRHRYDLLCVNLSTTALLTYFVSLFRTILIYPGPSGLHAVIQRGYSGGTGGVHWGYTGGTVGVQRGYRRGTVGVQWGYRRGTVVVVV